LLIAQDERAMGNEQEVLQRWKSISGDTSPGPWTDDNMGLFFQRFRADRAGLARALRAAMTSGLARRRWRLTTTRDATTTAKKSQLLAHA
jgi:hypothetical protein